MIVDKVIPFKQSEWLEKNISFITQKRNQAVNDFEFFLIKYSIMHFLVKLSK